MNLAAFRSALLRHKIVMRFGCCLVSMSMIMSCLATPKAKAVVSEGALLGSIFGSLLVSMGYSWAADNFDAPTFGEAIYDLIKECDEEMDTGIQLLFDSHLAGLTVVGNGKLTFSQQWVKLANSFAEWFQSKFFAGANTTAIVFSNPHIFSYSDDYISVDFPNSVTIKKDAGTNRGWNNFGHFYTLNEPIDIVVHYTKLIYSASKLPPDSFTISDFSGSGLEVTVLTENSDYVEKRYVLTQEQIDAGNNTVYMSFRSSIQHFAGEVCSITELSYIDYDYEYYSLIAEKPQEVHYPEVAADDSEVYEITVDGVTATDIEGIIQGAVDQILAGTAAIAGEVTQAQDVPAEPEAPPELDGLDLPALGAALTTRFPFSIPWDIARGIEMLAAPAEAPYWEVDFLAPLGYRVGGWKGSTMVVLDFSQFEVIGQVTRWMSTIGFCLMLASSTKRLIWVA